MPAERPRVLGVPVDPITTEQLLALIEERLAQRVPCRIVTVNAEFVMLARSNAEFQEILERADVATADGAGILWALRREGITLPGRVGGSDLVWTIPELCARTGARLFLLGGRPGVADVAADRLRRRFPGLAMAGTSAAGSSSESAPRVVDLIRQSRADVLFVAFGAPAQDVWLARHLTATGAVIGIGVGGSLDYVAGAARRAPRWMQTHGLEWLWRLIRQPWRWRRMLALPRFAWLVWREPAAADCQEPGMNGERRQPID